jgi:hypothetical protein
MIGLRSVASVVLIGISYGYVGGICTRRLYLLRSLPSVDHRHSNDGPIDIPSDSRHLSPWVIT